MRARDVHVYQALCRFEQGHLDGSLGPQRAVLQSALRGDGGARGAGGWGVRVRASAVRCGGRRRHPADDVG
jgi:hypothetical protein